MAPKRFGGMPPEDIKYNRKYYRNHLSLHPKGVAEGLKVDFLCDLRKAGLPKPEQYLFIALNFIVQYLIVCQLRERGSTRHGLKNGTAFGVFRWHEKSLKNDKFPAGGAPHLLLYEKLGDQRLTKGGWVCASG